MQENELLKMTQAVLQERTSFEWSHPDRLDVSKSCLWLIIQILRTIQEQMYE